MAMKPYSLITVIGPTASGKTAVAARLAYELNSEVISADSRQIYRKLDLGTGKDYTDYIIDGNVIPYHLIDIADPGTQYNVFEYQKDFFKAYQLLVEKGKLPILCGGSGMYLEAVLEGYKLVQVPVNLELRAQLEQKSMEELEQILLHYRSIHATTDNVNKKRAIRAIEIEKFQAEHPGKTLEFPEVSPLIIGIRYPRDVERDRITQRLKQRLKDGMIAEVEQLLQSGITPEQLIYYGLEYKFLTQFITGQLSYEEMFILLNTAIHQFAKRQMTWFRRMEKKGYCINWIDGFKPLEEKIQIIKSLLN